MAILVTCLTLLGCGAGQRTELAIDLGIVNDTDLTVTLFVNDFEIGTYEPGDEEKGLVPPRLPDPPWHAEARTSTGRVLLTLDVKPGDVWTSTADANGRSEGQGRATLLYLSCGRLDLFVLTPLGGPASTRSFSPDDCLP